MISHSTDSNPSIARGRLRQRLGQLLLLVETGNLDDELHEARGGGRCGREAHPGGRCDRARAFGDTVAGYSERQHGHGPDNGRRSRAAGERPPAAAAASAVGQAPPERAPGRLGRAGADLIPAPAATCTGRPSSRFWRSPSACACGASSRGCPTATTSTRRRTSSRGRSPTSATTTTRSTSSTRRPTRICCTSSSSCGSARATPSGACLPPIRRTCSSSPASSRRRSGRCRCG